jgi:hypothetical protein
MLYVVMPSVIMLNAVAPRSSLQMFKKDKQSSLFWQSINIEKFYDIYSQVSLS